MKNKMEKYEAMYMEEMNLSYLTMSKEDYALMKIVINTAINDTHMNKKEFKHFINKIIKDDFYMKEIKENLKRNMRGGDNE